MTNKELLKITAINIIEELLDEYNNDSSVMLEGDIHDDLVERLSYDFGDFDLTPEQEALLHKKVSLLEDEEEVYFYAVNSENLVLVVEYLYQEDEHSYVTLRDKYNIETFTVEEFFDKLKEKLAE